MMRASIQVARLADGRLHLNEGPIDLIIEAFAADDDRHAAYEAAVAAFEDILPELAAELALLRKPVTRESPWPDSPVGRRMAEACAVHVETLAGSNPSVALPSHPHPTLPRPKGGRGLFLPSSRHESPSPLRGGGVGEGDDAPSLGPGKDFGNTQFVTPMAAVAGAVADHVLAAMVAAAPLARAYVNDGGDIAFHLAPGQSLTCGMVPDLANPRLDGRAVIDHGMAVRGVATSGRAMEGQGGRSFSLGIADAVTVFARSAAAADVAATLIANEVDLPGHTAVTRLPASDIDPDSDLGSLPVTVAVAPLHREDIDKALHRGLVSAEAMRRDGLIEAAALFLRGECVTAGAAESLLVAA